MLKYKSIPDMLKSQSEINKNKEFLLFPAENLSFTYREFYKHVRFTSAYLYSQGVRKGDRIAICLGNCSQFALLYFGALRMGVSVVTINPESSQNEIDYIISDSNPTMLFNESSITEIVDSEAPEVDVDLADEAVVIYTSGTTGVPKGVVLSHQNFIADAHCIASHFKFSTETRTLCILPLFHNNGQVATLLSALYAGGSNVIVPTKTAIPAFWKTVYTYNVNWSSVMPSILSMLLAMKTERSDNTMHGIICGGQVLTREVQNSFEKRFNVPIFEGYGLTETTSFSCFNSYPEEKRAIGSIGKPVETNSMMIADEEGKQCKDYAVGEICISGLNVTGGYLNMTEKTKNSFLGKWFKSGDYGFKDSAGFFYIKGRKDNLIIKGGENIYPAEIENALQQHPAVEECAAIGVDDTILGKDIIAFAVINNRCTISEDELKEFCSSRISKHKVPKRVFIIDDLPKTATKKVLYRDLQKIYELRK